MKYKINIEDSLPYPILLYPDTWGAFIGFQESENSPIHLCSCAEEAVVNYIKLRLSRPIEKNADPVRMFILSPWNFPRKLVEKLIKENAPFNHSILKNLNFGNKLCHECNRIIPKYRYLYLKNTRWVGDSTGKMSEKNEYIKLSFGSPFKTNYGWYIYKKLYEYGIARFPLPSCAIPSCCPDEILDLINTHSSLIISRNSDETIQLVAHPGHDLVKQIWDVAENEVRITFGHKKIGEAWSSETILFYLVKDLFPQNTILRHYRPEFLNGLELDIFIKELNLGIEYQGLQHFKPVEHWGGEEALKKLKIRDIKKRELCLSHKVNLIYFNYDEELNNDFIKNKILNIHNK